MIDPWTPAGIQWDQIVLRWIIASTVLMLTSLITILACRQRSAATRHLAGALTCVALIVLPIGIGTFQGISVTRLFGVAMSSANASVDSKPQANQLEQGSFPASRTNIVLRSASTLDLETAETAAKPSAVDSSAANVSFSWQLNRSVLSVIYLAGMLLGCVRLAFQSLIARRLKSKSLVWNRELSPIDEAQAGSIPIHVSDHIAVPMVTGIFRPLILLPRSAESWPHSRVRNAVLHETAHVQRRDLATQLAASLCAVVYWPHPLVHCLIANMRRDREIACDDRVINQGVSQTAYARDLLDIAMNLGQSSSSKTGVLAMARTAQVQTRIQSILSKDQPRTVAGNRVFSGLLTAIALVFAIALNPFARDNEVVAQTANTTPPSETTSREESSVTADSKLITGEVVSADGKTVPNTLIVVEPRYGSTPSPRLMRSDESGRFQFPYGDLEDELPAFPQVWFYAEGHGIRSVGMRAATKDGNEELQVILARPETTRFQVLKPDGKGCRGAIVRPQHIYAPSATAMTDAKTDFLHPLPFELNERLERKTDGSGYAGLIGIPRKLIHSVMVESNEFGLQEFSIRSDEPAKTLVLQLVQTGSIKGRVLHPEPTQISGTTITIDTGRGGMHGGAKGHAKAKLDDQGRFSVSGIAAQKALKIKIHWDDSLDRQPRIEKLGDIDANSVYELIIPTEKAVTVVGEVLTEDTGDPVVNARIAFEHRSNVLENSSAITDQNGRYLAKVLPGKVHLHLFNLGSWLKIERYDYPKIVDVEVLAGTPVQRIEPTLLKRKRIVKGILQNAKGDPIHHGVVGIQRRTRPYVLHQAFTDQKGEFEIAVDRLGQRRILPESIGNWVAIEKKASGPMPPVTVRLKVVESDLSNLLLQLPE